MLCEGEERCLCVLFNYSVGNIHHVDIRSHEQSFTRDRESCILRLSTVYVITVLDLADAGTASILMHLKFLIAGIVMVQ